MISESVMVMEAAMRDFVGFGLLVICVIVCFFAIYFLKNWAIFLNRSMLLTILTALNIIFVIIALLVTVNIYYLWMSM